MAPPFRAGVDARLGVANAAGGVHGRKVTYAARDDQSASAVNFTSARELLTTDQVFGMIEASAEASGSSAFLHDSGIPVVGIAMDPTWASNDNMFSFTNIMAKNSTVSVWGDFVATQGGRRALILKRTASAASNILATKFASSLQAAGVGVVGNSEISPLMLVPAVLGEEIKAIKADTIIFAMDTESAYRIVAAARLAGAEIRVALVPPDGYDPRALHDWGSAISGTFSYVPITPFEVSAPVYRGFFNAMASYAPQLKPPNQAYAVEGWIAADMYLRGLAIAGTCPTRAGFISGLRSVQAYDAEGLLPTSLNISTSVGEIIPCLHFVQVAPDGTHFTQVTPTPLCGRRLATDD
ncbi:ABC-type branched-chain amino acid transport systems periplasmic component-like protein [Parafrankia sp. EUN1f]|nr:ABC-type branched-chain amino acid transport systems periplasmic component-like protein [Parafrankia sp. EUN1f]